MFVDVVKNNYACAHCTKQLLARINISALAQMVARLPVVQQVQGSIPGGVVYFNLKTLPQYVC